MAEEKVTVECPACKNLVRVPKSQARLRVKCPACQLPFVVNPHRAKPGEDTVAGWVNEAVFWWDDKTESNTYVGTNSLEQSRVRFTGEAKIVDGWSAGYTLEIGAQGPYQHTIGPVHDARPAYRGGHGSLHGREVAAACPHELNRMDG